MKKKKRNGILCSPNPSGRCLCGCGEHTTIAKQTTTKYGAVRGEPRRFIAGHSGKVTRGLPLGTMQHDSGYLLRREPDHPRASKGYVMEHILIAEDALGRRLPEGAEVHHVNGAKDDNRPENLVVCEDRAYHFLLHQRQRALEASGNADWRPCYICHEHDDPAGMSPHRNNFYHKDCAARYQRERRGAA